MKGSQVYETSSYHSFLQLPGRKTPTNRYSVSSKQSDDVNKSMRLPMIPNRSSFSLQTDRNTKYKLIQLSDKLE